MATEPNTVIALVSAWVGHKGKSVMVLTGEAFDRNDPIVKAYPQFFGQPAAVSRSRIEQATAAPGEKRS